ncbi:hypothetical protein IV203_031684 [Nitzschia inconspicua]|uniref:Uncharacterized protein n=1 Tax=Nitzschia inconspicua TaxID=303405 RepID=A0A9K3LYI8_9STRA|nr:hypothetical protein IV203_031684 [Nitzschia inconspicua]
MFGGLNQKELSVSESSTSVGSSTVDEEEDAGPTSDAAEEESRFDEDEEETSDEDDEEEASYDGTLDDELFEEDDDEQEEEETVTTDTSKNTIDGAVKSPHSSMETSHSFASEATEERAHVSSPRPTRSPPKKSTMISPFSGKRGTIQVDITPPTTPAAASLGISYSASRSVNSVPTSPASSGTNKSPRSRLLANRTRVPGGAAAKLIGRPTNNDYQASDDGDDTLEVVAPVEELMESREKARAEFSLGSTQNRRYHAQGNNIISSPSKAQSETVPYILNRSEIFHENAAAAIASLLSPSFGGPSNQDIGPNFSSKSGEHPSTIGRPPKGKAKPDNPFYDPRRMDELPGVPSVRSDIPAGVGADSFPSNSSLVQKLMNKKLDRRLEVIKSNMKDPSDTLTDLMTAIASPEDGNISRHYMVRRKNACGALKVMTANSTQRVNICWTVGVLPALTSVLEDSGPYKSLEDTIPDLATRREFIEARKRAVAALMNLALVDSNRIPMFHCPRLVASLIRVINQDDGEARQGCCVVLCQLSKSKDNRYLMAQVPGFLDAVTAVIDPNGVATEAQKEEGNEGKAVSTKKTYSEDAAEASAKYDEDPNEFLHSSRQNVFALLGNLAKEKDNAFIMARHMYLVDTLVTIARLQESTSQEFGLRLLAHFSRHRGNSKHLIFKTKTVVPAIVYATQSESDESRKYACFALQNFSQDKPCRQELASIPDLLGAVCRRVRTARIEEEKLAALHTLKNLTDEPANLIPMTNTPECFATLMQVAHASDESVTETMQYIGCDALATLSHWFRSIATSGQRIGTAKRNSERGKDELFVPTLRVVTWESWQ